MAIGKLLKCRGKETSLQNINLTLGHDRELVKAIFLKTGNNLLLMFWRVTDGKTANATSERGVIEPMTSSFPTASLCAAVLTFAPVAHGRDLQPVATLRDLGPALTRCFRAPDHTDGLEITIRFSLSNQGRIIGRPMVTHSTLLGSMQDKQAFVAAAFEAIASCTPVSVTTGFGAAIAGRPLSVRFRGGVPATEI